MVVLDTDILIALIRGESTARISIGQYEERGEPIIITALSWYELFEGICTSANPYKRLRLFHPFVENMKMMLFDDTAATIAAKNYAYLRKKGKPTGFTDNLIAAMCIAHEQKLVTRNVKHFKNIPGLQIEIW